MKVSLSLPKLFFPFLCRLSELATEVKSSTLLADDILCLLLLSSSSGSDITFDEGKCGILPSPLDTTSLTTDDELPKCV